MGYGTLALKAKYKASIILSGPKDQEEGIRDRLKQILCGACCRSNPQFGRLFNMLCNEISTSIPFKDTGRDSPDRIEIQSLDVLYCNPNTDQWKMWVKIRDSVNLAITPGEPCDE